MISNLSILYMVISFIISVFLPIGLTIYFYRKYKISLKAVAIGALIFIVFQLATRIPLLNYLSKQEWYQGNVASNIIILALFLSTTAGIFEECGRFIAFKYILKKERKWKNGIAYGIGHGGIESILLVGLTYLNNLIIAFLMKAGTFDTLMNLQGLDNSQIEAIRNLFINTPPYLFLFAGIERLFAIIAHIGFSLVVLYGVKNKKYIYLLYAILLHTLFNLPGILINNTIIAQIYLMVFSIISLYFIRKSKSKFDSID